MSKTINIEDFFTEDRSRDGVWFEPKIKGVPCGIEFLVTGTETDENVAYGERYEKEINATEEIKDPVEKAKKQKILDANRVAEFVKGIRPAENSELAYQGKPLEYSVPLIQKILLNAPLIKFEIVRFAKDMSNFMKREKNDSKKQ